MPTLHIFLAVVVVVVVVVAATAIGGWSLHYFADKIQIAQPVNFLYVEKFLATHLTISSIRKSAKLPSLFMHNVIVGLHCHCCCTPEQVSIMMDLFGEYSINGLTLAS